jgi:hypothetical protein
VGEADSPSSSEHSVSMTGREARTLFRNWRAEQTDCSTLHA